MIDFWKISPIKQNLLSYYNNHYKHICGSFTKINYTKYKYIIQDIANDMFIAFSNNIKPKFSAPTFEDCAIQYSSKEHLLNIKLLNY